MMDKINVNGKDTHDVYKFLRSNSKLFDEKKKVAKEIPWNFCKFLVSADGKKVRYYHPRINPVQIRPDV
jgi:glutathione peroxidase